MSKAHSITMIIKNDYSDTIKMITEMKNKIAEIMKIDYRDTTDLSSHRCNLVFYLRHHSERSEEAR